ncbi:pectate lyase, putative [Rhizoctonia solani AG-1 IB]|uniref:pectin lyase n=1 Tax=Thanatephorus cucumeris (strain AG1-IB / isolate 7/3/14) TaxID=1108050 RepID=A0A0B7FVN8_THACB|nr:pectate lyase, putative [Rhizoctonia solani AG-1 IB]
MYIALNTFIAALLCVRGAHAVGTAFGYASGTTGGGSAAAAVPTSTSQLVSWLGDSTARTILLDKVFDFTDTEGSVTGTACAAWTCSPNPQLAINQNNWCDNYYPSASKSTVTYKKAGVSAITVGSNKTLLGKGTAGGIKGKGLRIAGGNNIIIQNIRIYDLNPRFVWGGDAITIDGGSNIWIDHNYIQNIGRQMIVTGYGSAQKVTISDNVFEGSSTYSATCNGRHYWTLYFTGASDTITFARNYIYMTSGRGPKIGGTSGYNQLVHMYNNYWVNVAGHALDADTGAKVILEGNYFNTVTTPSLAGSSGVVYAPIDSSTSSTCSSYLGRSCYANTLLSSGSLSQKDTSALSAFSSASVVKSASIMAASSVGSYVQANAGLGKIN